MATDMVISSEMSLPSLEGLTPTKARSVILPHIFRFVAVSSQPEHTRDIAVLVNPTRRSITFLEGLYPEEGPLLASKASIEAMPVVKVLDEGSDCTICLSGFEISEEAKEMPCSHHFHSVCIDKWLGINRSCPICRYKMPMREAWENENEKNGYDVVMEIERARLMFLFHVIVRRDTSSGSDITSISVSEMKVHRNSEDVPVGAGDGDASESRDSDESVARDGDAIEVGGDEF